MPDTPDTPSIKGRRDAIRRIVKIASDVSDAITRPDVEPRKDEMKNVTYQRCSPTALREAKV